MILKAFRKVFPYSALVGSAPESRKHETGTSTIGYLLLVCLVLLGGYSYMSSLKLFQKSEKRLMCNQIFGVQSAASILFSYAGTIKWEEDDGGACVLYSVAEAPKVLFE